MKNHNDFIKSYRLLIVLIDNRKDVKRRLVLSLTEKIPTGFVQEHTYWYGAFHEVRVYVWGETIFWPELEHLVNYTFLFAHGEYDVQG